MLVYILITLYAINALMINIMITVKDKTTVGARAFFTSTFALDLRKNIVPKDAVKITISNT
jgi:hypothetical protein